MEVILKPYNEDDLKILGEYQLPAEQMSFTMLPSFWPNIDEEKRKTKFPVTIWCDDGRVGFFVLDPSNDKLNYTQNPNAFLLRSLSINPEFQGKGIGKAAMQDLLVSYCKQLNPQCDEIVFGVNETNRNAYQLYLKCGFIDTGNRYLGGTNGPQIIMSKIINNKI